MQTPRERLLAFGVDAVSDVDLVALIVGAGSAGGHPLRLATRILEDSGGLSRLRRRSPAELAALDGVGPVKAARLVASLEAGIRSLRPVGPLPEALRDSRAVFERYGRMLCDAPVERFLVVSVDAKNRPRAERTLAFGGRTSCHVDPSAVFRWLVRESAVGAVFLHNHPSGDPEPSRQDLELTARLVDAGALLDIRVLDHLIVGDGRYRSLRDAGLWPSSSMKSGPSGC